MNLPEILLRFDNPQRAGTGRYKAPCPHPAHDDSTPSVSISQDAATGAIMLYCFGCHRKGDELVASLGLLKRDLFGDPGHPAAVRISNNSTVSEEDLKILENYVSQTGENLTLAEDYLHARFGLSVERGKSLSLGVDPGDNTISRPEGYEQFNGTGNLGTPVSHLIIPLLNPEGRPIGMQGRRLSPGEPRWRSKSGSGWSKIGCFGWDLPDPVILCEGLSDPLAVVGLTNHPALAIRGASLTSKDVTNQIKEWLKGRTAIVIGDSGDVGEKFAKIISEQVGISSWTLPINPATGKAYGDLAEFLGDGGELDEAILLATTKDEPERPENGDTGKSPAEAAAELVARILNDLPNVIYDETLLRDLQALPPGQLLNILTDVEHEAPRGQVGEYRNRTQAIQRAVRDAPRNPGGGGPGDGVEGGDENPNPNGLPEILWNIEDQLQVTEGHVREAVNHYEGEEYYQAAPGQYVKVIKEELVNLKEAGVKSMLSQMGHWRVIQGQREIGHVPTEASKMVTDPSWVCKLHTIKRRVEVPFMLEDGNIVSAPGFHEESGVFLLPRVNDRIDVPEVPAFVTDEHVREAKRIFEDVVEGFVFKDECSRANLVAMTLTSPLRELFARNPMVPLLTSTAPQSGSGKGTSIRVPLSTAGIGPSSLSTTAYNGDENEFEKKLVGKLLKKSTYIFLDNIRNQVNSSVLEQMLTAANYDGRTLGYSEVNALSTLVLWVSTLQSTGSFNRDLTRRCVPVELIKNYKGKWLHKNIESYLADMRGPLIWACFVVGRKWMQDGGVISEARLDGYGGWTEVIGGILENVLEYEGFLGNLSSFRRSQDEVAMTVDGILERWLALYGEKELPARYAVEDFDDPALHQLLGLNGNPSSRQVLNALTRQLDGCRNYIINNSHVWTPVGFMSTGPEGNKKHYKCEPLPEED